MKRITQDHINDRTPDGTNPVVDSQGTVLGVTVRVWGPKASAVYLNGRFGGVDAFTQDRDQNLLLRGGLGFHVRQADGLRSAIRAAIGAAAIGPDATVDMDGIAFQIQNVPDFRNKWRAVQCVENHDLVYKGRDLRVAHRSVQRAIMVREEPGEGRDRTAPDRARDSTAVHGSGISRGQAVERLFT